MTNIFRTHFLPYQASKRGSIAPNHVCRVIVNYRRVDGRNIQTVVAEGLFDHRAGVPFLTHWTADVARKAYGVTRCFVP